MKGLHVILLKALVPAIATATGRTVYTRAPKDTATYPYIYISDYYQEENGPKNSYQYEVDLLIQVLHKDQTSLTAFYDDIDDILGIINNAVPFALDSPYTVMDCRLNNTSTTEYMSEVGVINAGLIRIQFRIK